MKIKIVTKKKTIYGETDLDILGQVTAYLEENNIPLVSGIKVILLDCNITFTRQGKLWVETSNNNTVNEQSDQRSSFRQESPKPPSKPSKPQSQQERIDEGVNVNEYLYGNGEEHNMVGQTEKMDSETVGSSEGVVVRTSDLETEIETGNNTDFSNISANKELTTNDIASLAAYSGF